MPWYSYSPADAFPHNPGYLPSYTNIGSNPPTCSTPIEHLCGIQANDSGGKPIITTALALEIGQALNNGVETTNVKLRNTL